MMVPIEQAFLFLLASVPFALATYGYWNTYRRRTYYASFAFPRDSWAGPAYSTTVLLRITALFPKWYGVMALYIAISILVNGKYGGYWFWTSPGNRRLIVLGAATSVVCSFWPRGANALVVMLIFIVVGIIGAEAMKGDSERMSGKENKQAKPTS